jgi:hypothetical protein
MARTWTARPIRSMSHIPVSHATLLESKSADMRKASGSFESTGPCPASHPVRLPQLMYEVMWDTTVFNDKNLWPTDGSQPFVYSMGDG